MCTRQTAQPYGNCLPQLPITAASRSSWTRLRYGTLIIERVSGQPNPTVSIAPAQSLSVSAKRASLLKNSPAVRFHPRSGIKQAGLGAFRARFVVAISSMATFSTGWLVWDIGAMGWGCRSGAKQDGGVKTHLGIRVSKRWGEDKKRESRTLGGQESSLGSGTLRTGGSSCHYS
jgi:hypothetical protein